MFLFTSIYVALTVPHRVAYRRVAYEYVALNGN
jgi:hypothetical protein